MAAPPDPTQQPLENPPSPIRQALSTGLMNVGFRMVGGALAQKFNDPGVAGAYAEFGTNITDTLQMDWWQQEARNFQQMVGTKYTEALQVAQEEYNAATTMMPIPEDGTETRLDPKTGEPIIGQDGLVQKSQRRLGFPIFGPEGDIVDYIPADSPQAYQYYLKTTRDFYDNATQLTMSYLDTAATEYPNNPIVAQRSEQVIQHIQGMMANVRNSQQQAMAFNAQQNAMIAQQEGREDRAFTKEGQQAERQAKIERGRAIAGDPNLPEKKALQRFEQERLRQEQLDREARREGLRNRGRIPEYFKKLYPEEAPVSGLPVHLKTTDIYTRALEDTQNRWQLKAMNAAQVKKGKDWAEMMDEEKSLWLDNYLANAQQRIKGEAMLESLREYVNTDPSIQKKIEKEGGLEEYLKKYAPDAYVAYMAMQDMDKAVEEQQKVDVGEVKAKDSPEVQALLAEYLELRDLMTLTETDKERQAIQKRIEEIGNKLIARGYKFPQNAVKQSISNLIDDISTSVSSIREESRGKRERIKGLLE